MRVSRESPDQPEVLAIIAELDAYQDSLYPPEARYALDLESLKRSNVIFVVARNSDGVGCGAVVLGDGTGELKRMYVKPQSRAQGVAQSVLLELESSARKAGCSELLLETGPYQERALNFYTRQGYLVRGPFGSYPEHPLSVFMGKRLDRQVPKAQPSAQLKC